jgi:hypothetical protein
MAKITRTEYIFNSKKRPKRITYSDVRKAVQAGAISVYFEDGKVLIDEDEADAYFLEKMRARVFGSRSEKTDLFA